VIRVTVELVPHGDESRATVLDRVVIAQTVAFDSDPEGRRGYVVWDSDDLNASPVAEVEHWRGNGARTLIATAFDAISTRVVAS
jgi:hypothetical protein